GTQTRHRHNPVVARIEVRRGCAVSSFEHDVRMHRNVDVRGPVRIGAKEFRRSDADHRKWNVIDPNRLSSRIVWSTKPLVAHGEADDGGTRNAFAIVIRADQPSCGGWNSKPAEIIAGHVFRACEPGLVSEDEVQLAGALIPEDNREDRIAPAEQLERRVGEESAD